MIIRMYSVYDSKLTVFDRPWFAMRDEAALRAFADAINDGTGPGASWAKHPEDYSLFFVGEFDDETGDLIPSKVKNLVTASSLKKIQEV